MAATGEERGDRSFGSCPVKDDNHQGDGVRFRLPEEKDETLGLPSEETHSARVDGHLHLESCEAPANHVVREQMEIAAGPMDARCTLKNFIRLITLLVVLDIIRRWRFGSRVHVANEEQTLAQPSPAGADALKSKANLRDAWGCTPLHDAASTGNLQRTAELLEKNCNPNLLDVAGESPLHLAARGGFLEVCELLLQWGALADTANTQGHTPLLIAGFGDQQELCEVFLQHGCVAFTYRRGELPSALLKAMTSCQNEASGMTHSLAVPAFEYPDMMPSDEDATSEYD